MPITLDELDGKYQVRSETSAGGPFVVNGDGMTEIRNGSTYRKDKNGFIWESVFSIIGLNLVEMESTIDPSHADEGRYIHDASGNLTKGMTTYKTTLSASRDGDRLILQGVIEHGGETTRLTMTKI